jgi:hypothetical protein
MTWTSKSKLVQKMNTVEEIACDRFRFRLRDLGGSSKNIKSQFAKQLRFSGFGHAKIAYAKLMRSSVFAYAHDLNK